MKNIKNPSDVPFWLCIIITPFLWIMAVIKLLYVIPIMIIGKLNTKMGLLEFRKGSNGPG